MYQKSVLDQGLRVLTSTMPHTRSVSVGFFIAVGSRYETKVENGVTHFIEHMLFKGTAKRPKARDIAVAIEGIGGMFNASTGRELTTYWTKVGQDHFSIALDVLADMLLNSKLEEEELQKERGVIIEEINMTLDHPSDWVHLLATELIWPDHPLGRDQAGTKESVSGITRPMVQAYISRHYQPANTVLAIAGNVDHDRVVEEATAQLSAWQRKPDNSCTPMNLAQEEARVRLERGNTQQAHLALVLPGVCRFDDDKYNLSLLNTILGQGMSSRLFLEIREKRGLAYSVYSYISPLLDTGLMGVYAGVDAEQIEQALQAILEELDKMRQAPVSDDELEKAKEFIKGRLQLQMEDSFSVASWIGRQESLEDRVLSVDEVLQKVDAVTTADIQRVAQRLIRQEKLNLAVIGPLEERQEERFGSLLTL
ncbi:MAG TPA: pitrilysin family protein [Anaerolineae bacterium]|nr:pitrilysin family protein [Anaerolineae bacterium]